jgi:hypothetical protein
VGHGTVNPVSVHFARENFSELSHSLNTPLVPEFQPAVCASTLSLGQLHDTDVHFS